MQETVLGTTQLIKSQGDNPEVKCRMSKCRAVQNINEMIINSIENVFGLHNLWFWEWRMPHAMQLWLTICVWTLDLVRGYWTKHADRLGEKNKKNTPRAPMLGKDLPFFKTRNDHFSIHRRNSLCLQDAEWSNVRATTLQVNSFPPHFHDPVPKFPWKFKKRHVRGGSLRLSQLLQNCLATDHVVRFSPISHFSLSFFFI